MKLQQLTSDERFLLEWLGKEDDNLYGECHGAALDALVSFGLADVRPSNRSIIDHGWDLVSLSDQGRELLSELRQ